MTVAFFLLYFVVVFAISVWSMRLTKDESDYWIAGGKLGWMLGGATIAATHVSAGSFIGTIGVIYTAGLVVRLDRALDPARLLVHGRGAGASLHPNARADGERVSRIPLREPRAPTAFRGDHSDWNRGLHPGADRGLGSRGEHRLRHLPRMGDGRLHPGAPRLHRDGRASSPSSIPTSFKW